jgi:hypothetical protein
LLSIEVDKARTGHDKIVELVHGLLQAAQTGKCRLESLVDSLISLLNIAQHLNCQCIVVGIDAQLVLGHYWRLAAFQFRRSKCQFNVGLHAIPFVLYGHGILDCQGEVVPKFPLDQQIAQGEPCRAQLIYSIHSNPIFRFDGKEIHHHKLGIVRDKRLAWRVIGRSINGDLANAAVSVNGADLSRWLAWRSDIKGQFQWNFAVRDFHGFVVGNRELELDGAHF